MKIDQKQNIEFTLQRYSGAEYSEQDTVKIVRFTSSNGKPGASIWTGKKKNPDFSYYFQSNERREEFIAEKVANEENWLERKRLEKEAKKGLTPNVKVGDIFYTSWGYEQTNVDFYQVVEIPSKHFVIIRELHQNQDNDSDTCNSMSCYVTATKDDFIERAEPFKIKVNIQSEGNEYIRINSSATAYPWSGKPQYKSWYY